MDLETLLPAIRSLHDLTGLVAALGHQPLWEEVPDENYDNAFKVQWELFLKHVAGEGAFRWNLLEGAKGVQLAELGLKSWKQKKWLDVPRLKS